MRLRIGRKFAALLISLVAVIVCAVTGHEGACATIGALFASFCTAITVQKNEHFSGNQGKCKEE